MEWLLMNQPSILLPVVCPECGLASQSEFPIQVVMIGLTKWHQMAFYADCHSRPWSASASELRDTRAFLGEAWMEANWGDRQPPYAEVALSSNVS
jgi:hypothetical protein